MAKMSEGPAVNLDVDFNLMTGQHHGRRSNKYARWKATTARCRQSARMARGTRSNLSACARPSLAYGARVKGVRGTDLARVWRILAAEEAPRTKGASLTMRLVLAKYPSWTLASGLVLA